MILSVSRRTDIPGCYPEWFMNRLRDKYVMTRNPMNFHQVSQINLSPDFIECIVSVSYTHLTLPTILLV